MLSLRWVPEFLLQGLALLPWGWLLAFAFNLVVLAFYLDVQMEPGFVSPLLLTLLQLMLLAGVTMRFLEALGRAERQKLELRAQVALAQAMINRAEQQRASTEVNQRIFSELHEDVGFKLLSIAHAGRNTRLGGLASSALENLRDAVSRANSSEVSLRQFLATLHEEMAQRLFGVGIALEWSQPSRVEGLKLDAEQHYQLARIFRELVNNIIRHANATRVDFSVSCEGQVWKFRLVDNGVGFDPARTSGDGLVAIRKWVLALSAGTHWDTRPGVGLMFTLTLPIPVPTFDAKSIS